MKVSAVVVRKRRRVADPSKVSELADSIRQLGLINPITVSGGNVLIAGLHRLEAVRSLGWQEIPSTVLDLSDDEVALAEIDENLVRSDLTVLQRSEDIAARKVIYERLHPEARHGGAPGKAGGGKVAKDPTVGSFVADTVAKTGLKKSTISGEAQIGAMPAAVREAAAKSETIADSKTELLTLARVAVAEPERAIRAAEKVASGEAASVREALREEARAERAAAPAPDLPDDAFDLIYADPPWQYDFAETEARAIENHYPTMTIDELKAMDVPAADNCVLFLWATAPKLLEAIALVSAWGFDYKTHAVWDKQKIGMGYWFRGQHELLLVATKGTVSPPQPSARKPSLFSVPRSRHSAKPEEVYEWLEEMLPKAKKIELFCRSARDGWHAWGNEAA